MSEEAKTPEVCKVCGYEMFFSYCGCDNDPDCWKCEGKGEYWECWYCEDQDWLASDYEGLGDYD